MNMDLQKYNLIVENPLRGQIIEWESDTPAATSLSMYRKLYLQTVGTRKIFKLGGVLDSLSYIYVLSQSPEQYPFFNSKALIEVSLPIEEHGSEEPVCIRMIAKTDSTPLPPHIKSKGFTLHIVQIDGLNKVLLSNVLNQKAAFLEIN